jgi:glycosyltransferase involved in cell wall biosynthesis
MKRVSIVQPILTNYRLPIYLELSRYCQVDLVFSPTSPRSGYGKVIRTAAEHVRYFEIPTLKPFGDKFGIIQWGLLRYIFKARPDAIVIFADFRYLSFWTTLSWAKLCGIPVYAHGHGLYRKSSISPVYRLLTRLMLRAVTSYIAYAPIVRNSFEGHGFSSKKVAVAHNTMVTHFTVQPAEKTGTERGILFIGRLRRDSNLSLLLRVVRRLRDGDQIPLTVHVVGTGEQVEQLHNEFGGLPWISWYGPVYDHKQIREISLKCFAGCYPGNAGLSVVHMIALSLPVVTHDDASRHGPEASFIQNGASGMFFEYANPFESLHRALQLLAQDPAMVARMQFAAFERYKDLVSPSLAARLWAIVSEEKTESSESLSAVLPGEPSVGKSA